MALDELPPDAKALLSALSSIAAVLVAVVRDETAKHAQRDEGPRYYDAQSAPMGKTAFLRLAAQGAFPSFRVGKRLRARASDVHAYIERQQGAKPRAPRAPVIAPEVDVNDIPVEDFYGQPGKAPKGR